MAEIIDIRERARRGRANVICLEPWEFRRAGWDSACFVQMLKSQSLKMEEEREQEEAEIRPAPGRLPPHHRLQGGPAVTIRAVYAHRKNEKRMREVYYLAGLIDCMINQVNPVLRTDLLRGMHKKVLNMKKELNVHWHAPLDNSLLPVDPQLYSEAEYRSALRSAGTMERLYQVIREGTSDMFDVLSLEYVFYCPGTVG